MSRSLRRPLAILAVASLMVAALVTLRQAGPGAVVRAATTGQRLAAAVEVPAGDGGWAPLAVGADGTPATWDPCAPVVLVVRPDGAPPGGSLLLADAIRRLSAATGLLVVQEGTTDEAPTDGRPAVLDRYGPRFAPVLVAWSDPVSSPRLAGAVAGVAGPVLDPEGSGRLVSGTVTLDGPQLGDALTGQAGLAYARAVVLHELGHLVGLGHVGDSVQLMYPSTTPLVTDYAAGDLRGLAAAGRGPCQGESRIG